MDLHMPKGSMFSMGTWSMMFAEGVPDCTQLAGNTISVPGAAPKEHFNIAPAQTSLAISFP